MRWIAAKFRFVDTSVTGLETTYLSLYEATRPLRSKSLEPRSDEQAVSGECANGLLRACDGAGLPGSATHWTCLAGQRVPGCRDHTLRLCTPAASKARSSAADARRGDPSRSRGSSFHSRQPLRVTVELERYRAISAHARIVTTVAQAARRGISRVVSPLKQTFKSPVRHAPPLGELSDSRGSAAAYRLHASRWRAC